MSNDNATARGETSLIAKLAVGAAQSPVTVEAWVTLLADTEGAPEFIDALWGEWLPAEPPNAFSAEIAARCREQIAAWHSGWPHLWAHVQRVAGYALWLADDAGITREYAYVLAMLHDVGKLEEFRTGEKHGAFGARFAAQRLAGEYDPATITMISGAIAKTGPDSAYARLLHDADKLDKIGATGILRRVSLHRDPINGRSALGEVAASLRSFPPIFYPRAETFAMHKRTFSAAFLRSAE